MIRWFGLFAAFVLWTMSLAEMKAQSLLPMPFSYIPISIGGTVTVDCDDIDPIYFTDDNNGGSNFQTSYTNQNHTITLCPDEPGDALALDFLVFDLETGVAASDNDVLLVYDGDNLTSPLLWSAEGDALEGLTITASASNLTGCITLEFVVNSGAFGPNEGWVARVRCGLPCAYPEAAVEAANLNPLPGPGGAVGLCVEEEVELDAGMSIPGTAGAELDSVFWNWGDGTSQSASAMDGLVQTHAYAEPGTYNVSVVVKDVLNCSSINQARVQVVAATKPIFNSEFTPQLCLNVPGVLDGSPVEGLSWTFQPTFGVSENLTLSDATGVTLSSELIIDAFEGGQTLEDCSHLEAISANLEHDQVGDLTISVTCPNGTEVVLLENPAVSAGTGVFGPDPNGCNLNASGTAEDLNFYALGASDVEGYDYAWNMDASHVIDGVDNPHRIDNPPTTLQDGTTVQSGLILPESYLPCGNFCDFEGCPLNGTWTFEVLDQWPSDDGTLFGWSIEFNPDVAPELTTLQPSIGAGADSSFWHVAGDVNTPLTDIVDGVESVSSDGNVVDVLHQMAGTYEYGFYAINNYGCAADTTVSIEVIEASNEFLSAGPDLGFCEGPIQLLGSFEPGVSGSCAMASGIQQHCLGSDEEISWTFCPDVPGDGTMMTLNLTNGTLELGADVLTVFDGPDENAPVLAAISGDVSGQTFTATNPSGCLFMMMVSDGGCDCASDDGCDFVPVQWCTHCSDVPGNCDFNFSWEPATALNDPTLLQPTLLSHNGSPTEYVLTVTSGAVNVCVSADTMVVDAGFEYVVEVEQTSCAGDDGEAIVTILGNPSLTELPFDVSLFSAGEGLPIQVLEWAGQPVSFEELTPDSYEVVVTNALGCTYTETFTLDEPEVISDPQDVLDHIDVRLESSPTQFLNAIGLPEMLTYPNGATFPLISWIDQQALGLFDWEGAPVEGVAIEGCSDAFLRVTRDPSQADLLDVVHLQWGGTALFGVDFSTAVETVELAPGEVEVIVPLVIVADSILEGVEDVTVEYEYVDECGGNVSNDSRMVILDALTIQSDPGVLVCGNDSGFQSAQFSNIQGFGPFMYQWGETPLSLDAPWFDLEGVTVSEVLPMLDANGEALQNRSFQLRLLDQCGQMAAYGLDVAQPGISDAQFCVDTTVTFPMLNPQVPITDLLVDGVSLLTSNILEDTLSVNAMLEEGHWLVGDVTTGGHDWFGLMTMVDTCGQISTAEWYILEYPCTDGCAQIEACNYLGEAAIDDGSCVYPGDECEDESSFSGVGVLNDQCECVEGLNEVDDVNWSFDVRPNPSKGKIWVNSSVQEGQIICRSLDGRIVHQIKAQGLEDGFEVTLPLSQGMYLVELKAGMRSLVERVVVED